MLVEVSIVLALLGLFWAAGRVLLLACGADDDWVAAPTGLCLVGLVANALYFGLDLRVATIQKILVAVAVACFVVLGRSRLPRSAWMKLLAIVGLFLLLAAPAAIGGEQFYVFRGNHWDQFNYINQSLALWANPASTYAGARPADFLDRDVLAYAVQFLSARPAVGLVAALALPGGHGQLHLLAFLYVTLLWALAFPAIVYAWRELLDAHGVTRRGTWLVVLPPLGYVLGFWGQYAFDLNAWSQTAALSLSVAMVFSYLRLLRRLRAPSEGGGTSVAGEYLITGILSAGTLLFYPENAVLHAAFLGAATVAWFAVARRIPGLATMAAISTLPLIAVMLSSAPNWEGTIGLLRSQLAFQSAQGPDWWMFFDNYWRGIHGGAGGRLQWPSWILNLSLALQGLFFVTPYYATPRLIRWPWMLAAAALSAGSYVALASGLLWHAWRNPAVAYLTAFMFAGGAMLLHLLWRHQLWAFGKGLSYLSPYLFLVLCLGLVHLVSRSRADARATTRGRSAMAGFAILFVALQLAFGGTRLWVARDAYGIGYDSATYPSVQAVALKVDHAWALDVHPYLGCRAVRIAVDDAPVTGSEAVDFQVQQLKQVLFYSGVPYYASRPIRVHFAVGPEVGMPPPIATDCTATLARDAAGRWAFAPGRS